MTGVSGVQPMLQNHSYTGSWNLLSASGSIHRAGCPRNPQPPVCSLRALRPMMTITRSASLTLLVLVAVSCKPAPPASGDRDSAGAAGTTDSSIPIPAVPDTVPQSPSGSVDSGTPRNGDPRRPATLADLRAEVMRMIGEATCSDVSQCRTIGFGAKPCGGPWQYLVYSTATTDSTALTVAVARYNSQEAALNKSEGRVSDCSVVSPPTLMRVNGRCVAGP